MIATLEVSTPRLSRTIGITRLKKNMFTKIMRFRYFAMSLIIDVKLMCPPSYYYCND